MEELKHNMRNLECSEARIDFDYKFGTGSLAHMEWVKSTTALIKKGKKLLMR